MVPIDELEFGFEFMDDPKNIDNHLESYPLLEDGAFIWGLYLEAAKWDYVSK